MLRGGEHEGAVVVLGDDVGVVVVVADAVELGLPTPVEVNEPAGAGGGHREALVLVGLRSPLADSVRLRNPR